jgi:hypothetical protein
MRSPNRCSPPPCQTFSVDRLRAYEAIADVYREWNNDAWTPEAIAEAEQRLAIDDADRPDSTVALAEFALRVLDRLGVVAPYDGPGVRRDV